MTMVTLDEVLLPALRGGYAVAGLVVLGWEDARAYVNAAEAEQLPVILQAGPGCRRHTPLPVLAAMFRNLGEGADVPVVAHLDHGYSLDECRQAIDCGFTSVMFDGSRHQIGRNIELTAEVAAMAADAAISCEGEIGFVGHEGGESSTCTDPQQAGRFARETGIDAVAVSVGNVHLQQDSSSSIDRDRLRKIEAHVDIPLVLHGGSGIDHDQRRQLAMTSSVCKFNIGTELRMQFGQALRRATESHPDRYDRIELLRETEQPVQDAARRIMSSLGPGGRHMGGLPAPGRSSPEPAAPGQDRAAGPAGHLRPGLR